MTYSTTSPSTSILGIDHIGIAVENLEASIAFYQRSFGLSVELREEVPTQKVALAFLSLPGTRLELLMPTAPESAIAKFLLSHGPGMHHLCYRVRDIRAELLRLKALGHKLIDETPRPGAHNTLIAFLHPKGCEGVLTELCEYRARVG